MSSPLNRTTMQAGIPPVIITGVILAVALIGGGIAYYFSSGTGSSRMETNPEDAAAEEGKIAEESPEALTSGAEVSRSFEQIFAANRNLECTWKPPATAGGEAMEGFVEGKLYTAGNRGRSMATLQLNGMPSQVNAIYNETGVTSWFEMSGQRFGFIMTNEEMSAESKTLTEEEKSQAEQYRNEMIISCKPWTPDESMFTIPSDIDFRTGGMRVTGEDTPPLDAEGVPEGVPDAEELEKIMREMER